MYDLADYARMSGDEIRVGAYAEALAELVRPDSVVLDLGAGTGLMALMACKLGARRVFAIEPSDAIVVARELARENRVEERLEIFQADSRAVALPERADIIVSDLRGALPLFGSHLEVIEDARTRLLAPGGVLVPRRDVLWAAPVECEGMYERHLGPRSAHGVTLGAARAKLQNLRVIRHEVLRSEQLLAAPQAWGVLDYAVVEARPVSATVEWTLARSGSTHAVFLWFEASVGSSCGYRSGPDNQTSYPSVLLPLERPLSVDRSDRLRVDLWASHDGDAWAWSTTLIGASGNEKARFKQSSLLGATVKPTPRRDGAGRDAVRDAVR